MTAQHFTGRHLLAGEVSGPFTFLNPTTRRYFLPTLTQSKKNHGKNDIPISQSKEADVDNTVTAEEGSVSAEQVQRKWRSRDNRKGRHAIALSPEAFSNIQSIHPPSTSTFKETLKGIRRMYCQYPYWDVSYLVAIIFTFGSVIWCINAFFVWLPLQDPATEFEGEIENAGGITAFIGATVFEIGSVILMLEAVNENRADCFGWAVEGVLEEKGLIRLKPGGCTHHHRNRGNLVGKGKHLEDGTFLTPSDNASQVEPQPSTRTWTWWPSWYELTNHYLKELGFLACLAQMIGATIFWIAGFTALPPIFNRLTSTAAQNGAYWLPQVLGGTGFIISGTLFMIETQRKWYLPALNVLGWHIGAWNLVGGLGFTLCGALGFASANSACVYQASLATFWGSWCFLIGSVIQWFESLDKHPVDVEESLERRSDSVPIPKP